MKKGVVLSYQKIRLLARSLLIVASLSLLAVAVYYITTLKPLYALNAKICAKEAVILKVRSDLTLSLKPTCSEHDQRLGYQNALQAPQQSGKLFVLGRPTSQSFWMKNVPFPLGLIYLDKDFKILSLHALQPQDETLIWSLPQTAYAIEINADYLSEFKVEQIALDKNSF